MVWASCYPIGCWHTDILIDNHSGHWVLSFYLLSLPVFHHPIHCGPKRVKECCQNACRKICQLFLKLWNSYLIITPKYFLSYIHILLWFVGSDQWFFSSSDASHIFDWILFLAVPCCDFFPPCFVGNILNVYVWFAP